MLCRGVGGVVIVVCDDGNNTKLNRNRKKEMKRCYLSSFVCSHGTVFVVVAVFGRGQRDKRTQKIEREKHTQNR